MEKKIIFVVLESDEGGYLARALERVGTAP